jgi:NADPH2:quinone reductase
MRDNEQATTTPDGRHDTAHANMRAVVFHSPGGPEVLSVMELPVPVPSHGQVRVRVQASPVFSADVAARSGALGRMLPTRPYHTLGWDMAGTVDTLGAGVTTFTPGDRVVGMGNPFAGSGMQAEFVVLAALELAASPARLSAVQASTIPANGLTALQALDALWLDAGDVLAVTGAAGGVGGYAAELAATRGLRVLGIGSERDEEFITGIGAEFVPRSEGLAEVIRQSAPNGVDGLLDAAAIGQAVISAVRDGGTFVALIPPAIPAPERHVRIVPIMLHSDVAQLRELVALAEAGKLTTRAARTFTFEEAAQAHALFAARGVRGRLVLVP